MMVCAYVPRAGRCGAGLVVRLGGGNIVANKRVGRMPKKHVELVRERSQGMCEGCHVRPANDVHHRRYLSRGGAHNVANLVHLCGFGNHAAGCHGLAHSGDAPEGWAVSAWDRRAEASIPFTDLHGVTYWLDDDGGKETDDFKGLE
jgi:hypothetical protein